MDVSGLEDFRGEVREWCRTHVPPDWRRRQTGVPDAEFVAFQQAWFQELRRAGYAVPHWPREWGGGMPTAEQVVLYQELAAYDAPRLVLAFVAIHHAAATLLAAGTEAQRRRHLPAILDGEIWVQGFSEPGAGSDLASLKTSARRDGDAFVVNGQKLWASGAMHADWCLLLARSDPDAPKRQGISYLLLDMHTSGIDVRPIRNAIGDAHFCEIFLSDVRIPAANLIGAENTGWQVAQTTLSAERGLTMLELAERLGAGFRRLVEECRQPSWDGMRPLEQPVVQDRLAALETELTGLRALCRHLVDRHEAGTAGPADASIVKLCYSELLAAHDRFRHRGDGPRRTHRATQTALQRLGIRCVDAGLHRLLGVDDSGRQQRDPAHHHRRARPRAAAGARRVSAELLEVREELRTVARKMLTGTAGWEAMADAGWLGLEVAEDVGGSDVTFAEVAVILQEMGRAAAAGPYLGSIALGVGVLNLLEAPGARELLAGVVSGQSRIAVALPAGDATQLGFRLAGEGGGLTLEGCAEFVVDAAQADCIVVAAVAPDGEPVMVFAPSGLHVTEQPVVDATRSFARVAAETIPVNPDAIWHLRADPEGSVRRLLDRGALAVACDSLGVAEAMLEATVTYAGVRQQFGRYIGSFQAVKHACADMLVQVTIGRELLAAAVQASVNQDPEAWVAVSMAKSFLGALAVDVAGKAMQLHGGYGYTWDSGVHTYLKRAVLNRALFGSPAAHRARIATRYA